MERQKSENERGHRSEIKHFCGKTTKLPVTLIQGQFCISPLWCWRLWRVDGKLVLEVNLYPEQGEKTPQEHCLTAAANQNTNLTHSMAQTANQSSTMDMFSGQTRDLTFRTNTQQSMGVSTGRAIGSCSSGYRNGHDWFWFCLLEAEKKEEAKVEQGRSSFSLFFLSGHLRLGNCVRKAAWWFRNPAETARDGHKDAQSPLLYHFCPMTQEDFTLVMHLNIILTN